ncbi:hypothetical protein GQ53DRAFT_867597 [Thozetella sp. PMI_491]|nr:hypothetical protein GQ53DRAFT_867597 [Thozetella sp. PMI_491]
MANSVVPYGKLKPEVKLAQAISEFALVLDEPRRRTFKVLRTRSPPLPSDVIRLTEEINSDGSRQHKSWKPFGTRLVAILERVQLISCVGDAIVYGAQNMIASGIWAAVKMSLQLATSYLTYFDKVTEILMRVGRMSHIKQDLNAMCEYLIVVTNFCRGIVLFTKKARFAQFISSVSREFLDFEDQLATWSSFIQERCNYLATKSQLESSKVVSNTSRVLTSFTGAQKKEQERQTQKRVFALQRHLSPYQSDFEPAWRRERRKGTATWIFTHRVYLLWCAKDTSDVLFISGSLGSGKTVLMANIFASIVSSSTLVRSETVNISPKFLSDSVPNTLWGENIDDLLNLALPLLPLSSYYIILDGLDDCSVQVVEEVAMILSKLMEKRTTRLCLSSRLGSKITGILEDSWPHALNISLSAVDRYDEIRTFVETEIDRRCSRYQYPISHVLLDGIKRTLSEKTEGMFLWLILQINALFPRFQNQRVVSDFDIIQLLETLPPDLPHAFDRAIEGITDMRYGSRLFEIIASAQRRLTLDELQVALNVKPGIVEWNPSTLPYHALSVIYSCGGGLLDVDEEDSTVAFIHSSVLTYLTNPRLNDPCPLDTFCFSLEDARMNMGYICITYLNYSLWERQLALINQPVVVANRLTGTVASAINRESSHMVLMSTFRAARDLFHPSRPAVDLPSFDLIRLLQQFSATPGARDIVRSFFGYARDFWLIHTSQFSLEDNFRFSLLLKRLLRNRTFSVRAG